MKHKLALSGLSLAVILVAVLVLSQGTGGKPGGGAPRSLVVTQDGKLVLDAQPEGYSKPTIIMENSKRGTNAPKPK